MADDENKLKLGKGVAFVKSHLKWLRQEDETWEAARSTSIVPGAFQRPTANATASSVSSTSSDQSDSRRLGLKTANHIATAAATAAAIKSQTGAACIGKSPRYDGRDSITGCSSNTMPCSFIGPRASG